MSEEKKKKPEGDDGPDLTEEDEALLDLAWQKVAKEEQKGRER